MDELTKKLQREAERIAAKHQPPAFYVNFRAQIALARRLYYQDPLVIRLSDWVKPRLQENLGHGMYHSMRVSIDSAALVSVEWEARPLEPKHIEKLMILSLLAGLLHDIARCNDNHAELGAREAARVLDDFPFSGEEKQAICEAIRNHEAFILPRPCKHPWSQLISDCLYDADKFRWGPDNFTHTLWYMAAFRGLSPQQIIKGFPWGMSGVKRIRDTFRTATGRHFGPQIVDAGITIGREIYHYLLQHYGGDEDGQ
jgi:hypothetical protein